MYVYRGAQKFLEENVSEGIQSLKIPNSSE